MANDMSFIDSILRSQILEKNISQIDETSEKTKKNISGLIEQLQSIRDSLRNEKLYIQDVSGERKNVTRWRDILDNQTYTIDYGKIRQDKNLQQNFIEKMLRAYELSTLILSELELIHSVSTVVTCIGRGYSYSRLPNFVFEAKYAFLNKQSSQKSGGRQVFGLRLNQKQIKQNIINKQKQKTQAQVALSNHFKSFIAPFVEYEIHAKSTTRWKPNKGVLGETFERHLENVPHNDIQSLLDNSIQHLGSYGERWILYKMSSGSDPFFTGPDTQLSQVKNINASIVSNIQTLINTIQGILRIVNSDGTLNKTKEELSSIFSQADTGFSMGQQIYEDLLANAPNQLKDILQSVLSSGETKITLTVQEPGKKGRTKKKYQINKETLSLEMISN